MMRSMFSGISGLRSHQTMMDVVGNNIANVNTNGFKASMVTFQEALTQILQAPSGAGPASGGVNTVQVGLGTQVSSIDGIFTQGASQVTGRSTDVAIQGDGFFVLEQDNERFYSRAGAFVFDEAGNLVAPGGKLVMGWLADPTTNLINSQAPMTQITLPVAQVIEPNVTTAVTIGGNLSADAAVGETSQASIAVYDTLGNAHELTVTFTKAATNDWTASAEINGSAVTLSATSVTFGTDGQLTSGGTVSVSGFTPPGADPLVFDLDFGTGSPLVQFGGDGSMEALGQDGNEKGFLRDFAITEDGTIIGQFSNGWTRSLGKVATASFNNPAGLVRVGESNFQASVNSGEALVGEPGTGNRGSLSAGTLEMSNVELAREFTNLIIAQRGFQANSRIITASDEVLADLVNMKR